MKKYPKGHHRSPTSCESEQKKILYVTKCFRFFSFFTIIIAFVVVVIINIYTKVHWNCSYSLNIVWLLVCFYSVLSSFNVIYCHLFLSLFVYDPRECDGKVLKQSKFSLVITLYENSYFSHFNLKVSKFLQTRIELFEKCGASSVNPTRSFLRSKWILRLSDRNASKRSVDVNLYKIQNHRSQVSINGIHAHIPQLYTMYVYRLVFFNQMKVYEKNIVSL